MYFSLPGTYLSTVRGTDDSYIPATPDGNRREEKIYEEVSPQMTDRGGAVPDTEIYNLKFPALINRPHPKVMLMGKYRKEECVTRGQF